MVFSMTPTTKPVSVRLNKLRGTNKMAGRKIGGTIVIFLFLLALGAFMVFPIYYAAVNSIKPVQELFIFPPRLTVQDPTLDNFRDLLEVVGNLWVPFPRYVFNSVFVTVTVTVFHCFTASMAAFVLAKCKFPGGKTLNEIIVISLLYQSNVTYIMQYIVMAKMGMIDTYAALILPAIATPLGLFLMRQSMSQIPDAMIEAAKVDGASLFRICWGIVIPNSKPALMTMIIFAFQGAWNITGGAVIFNEAYKTLPTVVQQIAAAGLARAGVAAATSIFMLVPPVLIFILAQRQVLETMAHSGIKE